MGATGFGLVRTLKGSGMSGYRGTDTAFVRGRAKKKD